MSRGNRQWRNVGLIFRREIRDQLRDRRTLFMIAVLPVLLYPAMGIGALNMWGLFQEQPQTVVILGADSLPTQPPLLTVEADRFVSSWFNLPQDARRLHVVSDLALDESATPGADATAPAGKGTFAPRTAAQTTELLTQARELSRSIRRRKVLSLRLAERTGELKSLLAASPAEGEPSQPNDDRRMELESEVEILREQLKRLNRELAERFARSRIEVLILIPDDLAGQIEAVNRQMAQRDWNADTTTAFERPLIVRNSADDKSLLAYNRVRGAMQNWEREILRDRLAVAQLPAEVTRPVNADPIDLAADEQKSASLWSKLIPGLLVIMAVTGAFYPAIDLGAGEKERGTMETLLICPASRTEIVLGKFFTVMLFSMGTALLNLVSMGFTGRYMATMGGTGALSKIGGIAPPSMTAMAWILVLLLPLAALFSALCLSLATFARSSKEGQHYLTPLLMVTLGLTVFCLSPGVEINAFYSLMPVVGVTLLLKKMLASSGGSEALIYTVPVLVTSIGYSLLALWWAIEQFRREDVLFREGEQFELRLWLQHLLRDKEPLPSFTEAGFCFVLIMLLQFGAMRFMGQALQAASQAVDPATAQAWEMMRLLTIQQIALVASPALFMAIMLTTSVRRTLRLYLPNWRMLAVACLLPLALNPLAVELMSSLSWFFPPLPEGAERTLAAMSSAKLPLWVVLMAFAFAPAICEEITFRGFLLSGFGQSRRMWLAIVLSSVTFGVIHMIPQQVFNATLLGLVLGLLAVRSGSLLPGVVFHLIFNGLEVLKGRYAMELADTTPVGWILTRTPDGLHFTWPTLVVAAMASIALLFWLVNQEQTGPTDPAGRPLAPPEPGYPADFAAKRTTG